MENFKVVKIGEMGGGWAIGILENFHYQTGEHVNYSVIRVNPQSQFVTLSYHKALDDARATANREWAAEMKACRG